MVPSLTLDRSENGVALLTDVTLFREHGIRIAFSQRHGGVSAGPFSSLNLSMHVGDDPTSVATNRRLLCDAAGLGKDASDTLNTALQVHDHHVENAVPFAFEHPATDALVSDREGVPLLLCFADCVPIILVDPIRRAIGVVHSGWRGCRDDIAARAVRALEDTYQTQPSDILAYIGPYIGLQNFTIGEEVARQFVDKIEVNENVERSSEDSMRMNLDLGVIVTETLARAGVATCNTVSAHVDTVACVSDYFSYRAERGITGRHGALACLR